MSETASLTRDIFGTMERYLGFVHFSTIILYMPLMLTCLGKTWEDPNFIHPDTKAKGDNDPLDVCEIGERVGYPGEIKQVKVLGILALLDGEDTDWKIITIDIKDPLAPELNDIEDIDVHMPGLLRATKEWFRVYKVPDGKPANKFSFDGECKNKAFVSHL